MYVASPINRGTQNSDEQSDKSFIVTGAGVPQDRAILLGEVFVAGQAIPIEAKRYGKRVVTCKQRILPISR